MIVDSSNEATQYVLDVITHTTGGYELPPKEMEKWQYQRNAVNRYFTSLGYTNINANQKTFCEDAYGREQVSRGTKRRESKQANHRCHRPFDDGNRYRQSCDSGAQRADDGTAQSVTTQGRAMMPTIRVMALPVLRLRMSTGARLWSKAGWTSTTRHDVAYIEMPDGAKFVLATSSQPITANEREIIPTVARVVIEGSERREIGDSDRPCRVN